MKVREDMMDWQPEPFSYILTLPNELLDQIAKQLTLKDLISLNLSNKRLRAVAQPFVNSHIQAFDYQSTREISKMLNDRPEILPYIKHFTRIFDYVCHLKLSASYYAPIMLQASELLQRLTNLRSLTLQIKYPALTSLYSESLALRVKYPQDTTLTSIPDTDKLLDTMVKSVRSAKLESLTLMLSLFRAPHKRVDFAPDLQIISTFSHLQKLCYYILSSELGIPEVSK
jgi:hypothetical protein